jgi:excisionase family DNA binding protein
MHSITSGPIDNKVGYTIDEAADQAGICRSNIYKAMDAGKLPARKLGRRNIILHADLVKFLEGLPTREVI